MAERVRRIDKGWRLGVLTGSNFFVIWCFKWVLVVKSAPYF